MTQRKRYLSKYDGTTKQLRKLGGVVENDIVVSINELPDGKAICAIKDISREFEKSRRVAEMLGLPNANSNNWTLVKSSTSDCASTQKHIQTHRRKQTKG